MPKQIPFEDDVYREFMKQKAETSVQLHVTRLTNNDFMRQLLRQNHVETAVRASEEA